VERPKLLWLDMTIATRHAEVDRDFSEHFDIQHCPMPNGPDDELLSQSASAILFEFDYPNRTGLSLLRNTKRRHPKLPILMLTTHHSEQLAVWTYRTGVLDYLVKPVPTSDVIRCKERLQAIQTAEYKQNGRSIFGCQSNIPNDIPTGQRTGAARLAPAVHFVKKNFQQPIRNADIAKLCRMSRFHFSHEFAERYSLTFQEFVLRYRILEACRQFQHPDVTVAGVAYAVGFNDPSYFARVFRRFTGLSPTEYCEQIRNGEDEHLQRCIMERLDLPEQILTESGGYHSRISHSREQSVSNI
jgi:AraC-like DNA-binding protein